MKYINLLIAIAIFAVAHSEFTVAYVQSSVSLPYTKEGNFSCNAADFSAYINSLLVNSAYPSGCMTPAVDIFDTVDVVYIEESSNMTQYSVVAEMDVLGTASIGAVASAFKPAHKGIAKLCLNAFTSGCPQGFKVAKLEEIDFANKTLLYRPKRADSMLEEVVKAAGEHKVLALVADSEPEYTQDEIVNKNILFVVVILLLIIGAVSVMAVANIDYGEDTAGLYSKFKQDQTAQ